MQLLQEKNNILILRPKDILSNMKLNSIDNVHLKPIKKVVFCPISNHALNNILEDSQFVKLQTPAMLLCRSSHSNLSLL